LDWPPPEGFVQRAGIDLVGAAAPVLNIEPNRLELTPKPERQDSRRGVNTASFKNKKIPNYAERDARNRALGLAGEMLVLDYERHQLIQSGCADLAEKIVHVSEVEGDAAGYDIRSYTADGAPKYIEVKTTRGSAETDFFLSANQVEFSRQNPERYFLYRLYQFDLVANSAKFFVASGFVTNQFALLATEYRVRPAVPSAIP